MKMFNVFIPYDRTTNALVPDIEYQNVTMKVAKERKKYWLEISDVKAVIKVAK
jgi:hypothetical protein